MREIFAISDLHLGVNRVAGSTVESALALKMYAHQRHYELLQMAGNGVHVVVNGDLTDEFNIPMSETLLMYQTAHSYLGDNPDSRLTWALGNHSLSKDSSKMGAEQFVGRLLEEAYPERFTLVSEPAVIDKGVYVIPHLVNTEAFDAALKTVPADTKLLFLHCNYNNHFAAQSRHSLNLTEDQARALAKRGITVVLGHEHQHRSVLGGKVVVVGNQFPTSVADCLGNDVKYVARISNYKVVLEEVWKADGSFLEIDWRKLPLSTEAKFIRIVGSCTPSEAVEMSNAVANYRKASTAFVVANSVVVESADGDTAGDFEASLTGIQSFDVLAALADILSAEEMAAVREVMK